MSVPTEITDGRQSVSIQQSAMSVTQFPPDEDQQVIIPVVRLFTINGDGVTQSLKVDGSINPVQAFIEADADGDIYITEINVIILAVTGGANSLLSDFGAIAGGLTNGCILFRNIKDTVNEFREFPIKTNFNWVTIGTLTAAIGADQSAFRMKEVLPGNNSFGYNPRLDMKALNPPFGLRLQKLTADRLGIIIQDDLTVVEVSEFIITAIGFKKVDPT